MAPIPLEHTDGNNCPRGPRRGAGSGLGGRTASGGGPTPSTRSSGSTEAARSTSRTWNVSPRRWTSSGRGGDAVATLQRAYAARVDTGDVGAALRDAFWLWRALAFNAEFALAGAWIARAARLAEAQAECAQQGYLLLPDAERELRDGDYEAAFAARRPRRRAATAAATADLATVGRHLQGRALVGQGRVAAGLVLLDEAMLAISAGETSSRVTAWIYCKTIQTCQQVYDVGRAREWTVALNAWCDARPQFTGAYSGTCRIHRSELLQLGGAWPEAAGRPRWPARAAHERLRPRHHRRRVLPARGDPSAARRLRRRRAGVAAGRRVRLEGPTRHRAAPPRPGQRRYGHLDHPSGARRGDGPADLPGSGPGADSAAAAAGVRGDHGRRRRPGGGSGGRRRARARSPRSTRFPRCRPDRRSPWARFASSRAGPTGHCRPCVAPTGCGTS